MKIFIFIFSDLCKTCRSFCTFFLPRFSENESPGPHGLSRQVCNYKPHFHVAKITDPREIAL